MSTTDDALYCSCCGRMLPRRKLHALGDGSNYICRRCGLWVALRPRRDRVEEQGQPDSGAG